MYANNNPVINIDPDGNFSIRTSLIKKGIDLAILAIPGLGEINSYLKYRKMLKVHNLFNGHKIKMGVTITNYLTHFGVARSLAKSLSGTIINGILTIFDTSVGGIAVSVLKRFFKTYKKKEKKYIYWGPKVKIEYMNFSKRK